MNKEQFLAMSLRHELCCEILDYKSDYVGNKYDFIVGINQWSKDGKLWSAWTVGGARPALDKIRPILHSLSDLTKPIEHNGETFVPIEWIEDRYYTLDLHKQAKQIVRDWQWVYQSKFLLIQHLIEWHFDIANLIEKGEAIDVNTLEINPYK